MDSSGITAPARETVSKRERKNDGTPKHCRGIL